MNEMFWSGFIAGVISAFVLDILTFLGFIILSYLINPNELTDTEKSE